jgi:hypothetical protein
LLVCRKKTNVMPNPEEKIAELAPRWIWNVPRCLATDLAVNYAIEQVVDPASRNQLIASTLETTAAAYRALSEGAAKAAKIVGSSQD